MVYGMADPCRRLMPACFACSQVFSCLLDKPCIFSKRLAFRKHFIVMPIVNIDHPYSYFNIRAGFLKDLFRLGRYFCRIWLDCIFMVPAQDVLANEFILS
jgi:hypothetical protein